MTFGIEEEGPDSEKIRAMRKGEGILHSNSFSSPGIELGFDKQIYNDNLGGGFKHFLFSTLFGEDSHFD